MRDSNSPLLVFILCLLVLGVAAAPAQVTQIDPRPDPLVSEPEQQEPESEAEKRLDLRLSLAVEGDDNILHLRGDAIAEFESGVFDPDKFLIDSVEDTIFSPRLDLTFSLTPETRRKTRIGLSAASYRFGNNPIKDYERYQLRFEREFSDTRPDMRQLELTTEDLKSTRFRVRRAFLNSNRSRLLLRYSFGPERYLGQLVDDDGGGRRSARLEAETWDVQYLQRLDRGDESRWNLMLRLARDEYDYNVEFDERDSETDRYEIGLNRFHLAVDAYWLLGLSFEFAERRSNTALIGREGPAGAIQDDLSYDGEALMLRVGRYWYRAKNGRALYKSSGIAFEVEVSNRDYITGNSQDLSHFLRGDDYWTAVLAYSHPLSNNWVLDFWAEYEQQETNLDPVAGFDRLEPSDFERVVFGVRISYYASKKTQRSRPRDEGGVERLTGGVAGE